MYIYTAITYPGVIHDNVMKRERVQICQYDIW